MGKSNCFYPNVEYKVTGIRKNENKIWWRWMTYNLGLLKLTIFLIVWCSFLKTLEKKRKIIKNHSRLESRKTVHVFPIHIVLYINFKKLRSVFYGSVLILMINCITTLSKWLWDHKLQGSGSALSFDNVMTKFIINKRTDP